jgi:predicted enzyme related to lactoylglutathione lyase
MLEPSTIVLYVDNLAISSMFYQNLLAIKPEEASPTFHTFTLSKGMGLGLKTKHSVEPPVNEHSNGSGELAFTLKNKKQVDDLFAKWQQNKINIIQTPTVVAYGYTFVALDPDSNRLRVVSLGKS